MNGLHYLGRLEGKDMRIADRDLIPLGLVSSNANLAKAARVAVADPERAAAFLRRHRVVGIGLRNLAIFAAGQVLPTPLADLRIWRTNLDALLDFGEAELQTAVRETGVAVQGIKGLSMRALYDNLYDRDSGDLDLMVSNVDDAWKLAWHFRTRGFDWCEYEWPWLKRDARSRDLYGQFQIWQQIDGQYLRFDIHFGGYSVRHCRLSAWTSSGFGYRPATPTANLPCLLGNAAGDFLIRLKDVNDIVVLLRRGVLDQPTVDCAVLGLGLERFWNALLSRTSELAALTIEERAVLSELCVRGVRPQHVPFGMPSRTARTIATVLDAARAGREDHGFVDGLANGLGALRYYAKKLTVQINACKHARPSTLVANMSNTTCVRLIPQRMLNPDNNAAIPSFRRNISGSGLLDEVIVADHTFVEAEGERFVPTLFHRLCSVEANGGSSQRTPSERGA